MNRRAFLRGAGQAAAVASAGHLFAVEASAQVGKQQGAAVDPALAEFIPRYMRAMYAPGMTLGLVHADGRVTATGFGLSDVAQKLPVKPEMLFQIGSISKSFCALVLMQLRDEGKLDVRKPILDYLPWLPFEMPYGPVTVHDLLTHGSGMPGNASVFLSDRNARHRQGYKPGTQFHYSNMAFEVLGLLAETLDGKTYAAVLQTRILDPLEMKATRPAISNAIHGDEAESYVIFRDDLAAGRDARLATAPRTISTGAEGCIASTPGDMAKYMKMLLARGVGPKGRICSEASFALFATPYIDADEFGKGTRYGYGIAVDTLDGHKVLRHTGGMQSFASSMWVDLDGGVAAFASINAMQGYRPNPVAKYAVQVMRAEAEKKPVPAAPKLDDPKVVENAAEYAGLYAASQKTEVVAEGTSLFVVLEEGKVQLERTDAPDTFAALTESRQKAPWVFGRAEPVGSEKVGKVVDLTYGGYWATGAAFKGERPLGYPESLRELEGYYDSGTDGFHAIVVKGKLMVGGVAVTEIGDNLFRFMDEPNSPETVEFLHVVSGKARMASFSGNPYWRMDID